MVTSLVTPADIVILDEIKSNWSDPRNVYIPKLSEVECAARLAAAGLLTSLIWMNLSNIDASKVEKMSNLASIIKEVIGLDNVSGRVDNGFLTFKNFLTFLPISAFSFCLLILSESKPERDTLIILLINKVNHMYFGLI